VPRSPVQAAKLARVPFGEGAVAGSAFLGDKLLLNAVWEFEEFEEPPDRALADAERAAALVPVHEAQKLTNGPGFFDGIEVFALEVLKKRVGLWRLRRSTRGLSPESASVRPSCSPGSGVRP